MENKNIKTEQTPPEPSETKLKKRRLIRRFLPLAVVLVIVLIVVTIVTMANSNQFAALRRYLKYGDSAQIQDLYTYASHQRNTFEPLKEELLVVNPNSIQLLHRDGHALYELQVNMTAPLVTVGSDLAAVYDAQGNTVYVFDSTGLRLTHRNADGLLSGCARLNRSDYLAITEQKTGCKASVSVYNSTGTLIFRFDSHDHYLVDAVVTENGEYLIALALGENKGSFAMTMIVYDLATAERIGAYPLQDGLALDLAATESGAVILCDNRLAIVTAGGVTPLNYAYEEEFLHHYALTGSDFCALLMSRYQASNICTLTTFSLDGAKLAALELKDEVLDMSAAGNRLAVLYSDALVLYDRNLNEVARLDGTDHAGCVRMNPDGTALLIGETSAKRFLP